MGIPNARHVLSAALPGSCQRLECSLEQAASRIPNLADRHTLRAVLLASAPRALEPAAVLWHLEATALLSSFRTDLSRDARNRLLEDGSSEAEVLRDLFSACLDLPALKAASGAAAKASPGSLRLAQAVFRFDALQILGISASQLAGLKPHQRSFLISEIDSLAQTERSRSAEQVLFGIDDSKESLHYHLKAQSLVIVKPQHAVPERVAGEHAHLFEAQRRRRRSWRQVVRHLSIGSRTMLRGWVATSLFGLLALPRAVSPARTDAEPAGSGGQRIGAEPSSLPLLEPSRIL